MVSAVAVVGATLTGCPGPDETVPDAPPAAQGLTLSWRSRTAIPTAANPALTEATLFVRSARVIGDAGDGATTLQKVALKWSSGTAPTAILFDQAPAGKYAKIDLIIGGKGRGEGSYEFSGAVRLGPTTYRYEIEDEEQISVSLPLPSSAVLAPGGSLRVGVMFDLQAVVDAVDFEALTPEGDVFKIHDDEDDDNDEVESRALAAVRAAIQSAVRLDPM
jgi:hypothetical protein